MRFPQWRRGLPPKIKSTTLLCWPIISYGNYIYEPDLARYGGTSRTLYRSAGSTGPARSDHAPVDNALRRTSDTTYMYHNGPSGQDSATMQGSWTCSFWARCTGGDETRGAAVNYGGNTSIETLAYNFQMLCGRHNGTGTMEAFWEYDAGKNIIIDSGVVMPLNEWHLYTYRKNGTTDFKFYIDGELVSTQTTCNDDGTAGQPIRNPNGGTTGNVWWRVMATQGTKNNFFGDMGTIIVEDYAITDAEIREQFRRGLALDQSFATWAKLEITDYAGTYRDMTAFYDVDWVESIKIDDAVDKRMTELTATLKKNVGDLSLAYANSRSALNRKPSAGSEVVNTFTSDYEDASGNPESICSVNRKVRVTVARMPPGVNAENNSFYEDFSTANKVFEGIIDDVDWGGPDTVKIKARDLGAKLRDAFFEDEAFIPSDASLNSGACGANAAPSETGIQDIINAAAVTYTDLAGVTVDTPTSPGFCLMQSPFGKENVLKLISLIAENIGWVVRYRWDPKTEDFKLTYYEPDRNTTHAIVDVKPWSVINMSRASIKLDEIRNSIRIVYKPAQDSDYTVDGPALVRHADAINAGSITKYGRRYMEIAIEEGGNLITTSTEAGILAGNIVSDLALPKAEANISMPISWFYEVNDYLKILPDGVRYTYAEDLAVAKVTHQFDLKGSNTSLQMRGKPSSGFDLHHSKNVDNFLPNPPIPAEISANLGENLLDKSGNLVNPIPSLVTPRIDTLSLTNLADRISPQVFSQGGTPTYNMANGSWTSNSMGTFATPDGFTYLADGTAGSTRFAWDGQIATTTGNANSLFGENYIEMAGGGTSDVLATQSLISKYIPINGLSPFRVKSLFSWAFANTILQVKITFYHTTRPAGLTKAKVLLGQKLYNFSTSASTAPREEYFNVDSATISTATGGVKPSSMKVELKYLAYGAAVPTDNVKIYNVQCFPLSPNGRLEMPGDLALSSGGKDEFLISGMTKVYSNFDDTVLSGGVMVWQCPQTGIYELTGGLDVEQSTGTENVLTANILKYDGTLPLALSTLSNYDVIARSPPILCDINYALSSKFGGEVSTGSIVCTEGDYYALGYFKSANTGTIKQLPGSFFAWKHLKQVGDY